MTIAAYEERLLYIMLCLTQEERMEVMAKLGIVLEEPK